MLLVVWPFLDHTRSMLHRHHSLVYLLWGTISGRNYQLQSTTNLVEASGHVLQERRFWGDQGSLSDGFRFNQLQNYYRVLLLP